MDTGKGLYNSAMMKLLVTILFTIFLNYLCTSGMQIIAWFIVFIPFILMSLIISILLYVFGLDPKTGKINLDYPNKHVPKYPDPRSQVGITIGGGSTDSHIATQRHAKKTKGDTEISLDPSRLDHYIDSDSNSINHRLRSTSTNTTNGTSHSSIEDEKQKERTTHQNSTHTESFESMIPVPYS